jgi:Outer membrane protein beta-barrel domain
MNRVVSTALALAAGALTIAAPLAAQQQPPRSGPNLAANQWAIDGSLGFSVPTQSGLNTGIDVMGAVEWNAHSLGVPLWFRGEIGYSNWGVTNFNASIGAWRFLADAVLPFHIPGTPFVPYALAGLGIYHEGGCCDYGGTGFGLNFGGGIRYQIAGIEPYFEVRYHAIFDSAESDYLPFQFGVRFKLP